MKFITFLFFVCSAFAQNQRFDVQFPSITTIGAVPYVVANIPPISPVLAVCHSPANAVPCTNYVTTFTGSGASCPNGAQDTPQPASTSACQVSGDAQGNIGFWVPVGIYDYTVCVSTKCYGPFTVSLGGGACSGSGCSLPIGVSSGSALVSSGVSNPPIYQIKSVIDVRDISGVDCTGAADSTSALNTTFANGAANVDGHEFVLPYGCVLKIGSNGTTWTIRNHMGFKIRGMSQPGDGGSAAFGNPEIQWCQSSGPASQMMIDMERVHSFGMEGIVLDAHGPVANGCATPAGIALNVDISGAGNLITTFGEFRNISVLAGGYQGGSHDTNFIGMQFSATSLSNMEDMRIYDSSFNCSESTPGNGNSQGIVWGPSFNTHEEWVYFTNFSNCRYGQNLGEGQVFIFGGDYSSNGTDFLWRGNAQSGAFISGIESENSGQFFVTSTLGGGTGTLTIKDDDFEPFSFALPNTCGVDLNSNGSTAMSVTIDNFGTGGSAVTGWKPFCSNQQSTITFRNMKIADITANPLNLSGNARFPVRVSTHLGTTYSYTQGGYFRIGGDFSQGGNEDMGYGFLDSQGYEVPGLGYNNSTNDGLFGGALSIGRDSTYLGSGANLVLKAMRPISQPTITCAVNGAGGVTNYQARIFAKDAAGKRGGWPDYTGNEGRCTGAAASFTVGNGVTVTWPTVPNATNGYDVILMNASNTAGWLAGSVAQGTTTLAITSGPGSFNYSFPNYFESAQTTINGESLTINAPTTLPTITFANLPASTNGTILYCSDCKNVIDDTTGTFDSTATSGGHGTNVLRENGSWRVH